MGWFAHVYDSYVLDSYTSFYEKLCLELPFWSHYRVSVFVEGRHSECVDRGSEVN